MRTFSSHLRTVVTVGSLVLVSVSQAGDNKFAIRDLLFESAQEAREKLHETVNRCIDKVAKVPADQKTVWCRDQLSRRITSEERMNGESARFMASSCTDDDCRKRAAENAKSMAARQKERADELKDQLGRCDKEAAVMLEQRCKQLETSFHPPTE